MACRGRSCIHGLRKRRKPVLHYMQEFSDATTLHGIRYIGESNRHWLERLGWLVAVVLCAVGCFFQIQSLWDRWQTSPVIVSFAERSTAIWDIPFPALTICPENKIRRSQYDIGKELAELKTTNSSENATFNWEAISMVCSELPKDLMPNNSILTHDHIKAIKKFSPTMKDVFEHCEWEYAFENECEEMFSPVLTDEGLCYTFNMLENKELFLPTVHVEEDGYNLPNWRGNNWDPDTGYKKDGETYTSYPRRAVSTGPKAGLTFLLKTRPFDIQPECRGDALSYKMVLHAPSEFPQVTDQYFYVSPDRSVAVSVRPNIVSTSNTLRDAGHMAPIRGCYFPEERQLKFFKVYTQRNCEMECLAEIIIQQCNCSPFYMPKISKKHQLYDLLREGGRDDVISYLWPFILGMFWVLCIAYLSDKEAEAGVKDGMPGGESSRCKCLPSCREYKYDLEISTTKFNISNDKRLKTDVSEFQYVEVSVFFKDMQFITSHRSELYGKLDFLANCGGLLGLFTGFSVISLIEFIYFVTLRLCCHLRRRHKLQHEKDADATL